MYNSLRGSRGNREAKEKEKEKDIRAKEKDRSKRKRLQTSGRGDICCCSGVCYYTQTTTNIGCTCLLSIRSLCIIQGPWIRCGCDSPLFLGPWSLDKMSLGCFVKTSNLLATASNLLAMASNLLALASNLIALTSKVCLVHVSQSAHGSSVEVRVAAASQQSRFRPLAAEPRSVAGKVLADGEASRLAHVQHSHCHSHDFVSQVALIFCHNQAKSYVPTFHLEDLVRIVPALQSSNR